MKALKVNMVSRDSGCRIEPYRDGVVASIETQYGVEAPRRLTFLCRSEGPYILFSRLLDGIDPESFIRAIGAIQLYLDEQPMRTGIGDDRFESRAGAETATSI